MPRRPRRQGGFAETSGRLGETSLPHALSMLTNPSSLSARAWTLACAGGLATARPRGDGEMSLPCARPSPNHAPMGTLYYGDNLDILRRYLKDESVDLHCEPTD